MSATPAEQPEGAAVPRTAERRWPMAVAVLATIALQVGTPKEGRIKYWWVFPILEGVALVAVLIRDPGRIDRRTRAARRTTIALITLMTIGTLGSLDRLDAEHPRSNLPRQ